MKQQIEPRKWHGDPHVLGITRRDYFCLTKFLPRAESLGLEATGLNKGPFGSGCRLKMIKGNNEYELDLNGVGEITLGRIQNGRRTTLCKANSSIESEWNRLLRTLEQNEKGAAV